jgi:hypothetical protein
VVEENLMRRIRRIFVFGSPKQNANLTKRSVISTLTLSAKTGKVEGDEPAENVVCGSRVNKNCTIVDPFFVN